MTNLYDIIGIFLFRIHFSYLIFLKKSFLNIKFIFSINLYIIKYLFNKLIIINVSNHLYHIILIYIEGKKPLNIKGII